MTPLPRRPTYWEYIRVEDLLTLQGGIEGDEEQLADDEVRFIVIHQVDELWFKLVLRELRTARDLFRRDYVPETALAAANLALRRVALIFQLASDHFRLMESMRSRDYLRFRDKLSPASGFQSAQMREIEVLMGLDDGDRIAFGNEASYRDALRGPNGEATPASERVARRSADRPSLKEAIYAWLQRTPIHGSKPGSAGDAEAVASFLREFLQGHEQSSRDSVEHTVRSQALTPGDGDRLRRRYGEQLDKARAWLAAEDVRDAAERPRRQRLRAALLFIDSHRELPLLSWPCEILDTIVEAEQAMLIFRQRHARMVERVIGRRIGTGGSDGVDYLDQTALRYRVFQEIWAARTLLLRPELAPPVRNQDFYGLRAP
ncbi:MAG: tryptophan 2,3-dioxygenase [Planctomycetes bacterium]|nr:tryptophan 2,3-dioxygenase [Planctomycetota bacterium]